MSTIALPATANLASVLSAATAGTTYELTANATYSVPDGFELKASGVTVNGNGATIIKSHNATAPSASTIVTSGGNLTINNLTFASDNRPERAELRSDG